MKEVEITCCLLTELAKLVQRSDEKTETISEGALKFLNAHSHAFLNVDALTEKLEAENRYNDLFDYLFGKEQEPCYLPFTPGTPPTQEATSGFLVHVFKGEQDIVPLSKEKITITPKQYYRLFHTLRHDLKRLEQAPSLETWLYLLQRYTKWIPAGTNYPNVSLYDYTRIRMALCACIGEERLAKWWEKQESGEKYEEKVATLCAIEIWGRDDFFYQMGVESNLKLHKGAMYYIQMVREHLATSFLQALEMPLCNCIYEGEDKILLMLPAGMEKEISKHQAKMEKFLLEHFGGILGLATYLEPIALEDLKERDFSQIWDSMWERVDRNASRSYWDCVVESPEACKTLFGPFEDEESLLNLESLSRSCETLGDELAKARWAVTSQKDKLKSPQPRDWQETLSHFETSLTLFPKKPELQEGMQIYRFGNTDFACPQGAGFKFSEILPYLMAEHTLHSAAIGNWTVVNIRIDENQNLKNHSMWSYLTTREYLHDFFRTYLASLLREKKYRKYTYVLHSADHKLTMVCSPQIALMLVDQINQKFSKFTDERFTMSARVSVYSSEYSLHRALYREEREFALQSNLRNKIVIMEENVSWTFLEGIIRVQEKLSTIAKLKGKRFLFPLWGFAEHYRIQARKYRSKKDTQLWRHMLNYYLNRLGITDNLEVERGPVHLSLAIRWNHLMSQES